MPHTFCWLSAAVVVAIGEEVATASGTKFWLRMFALSPTLARNRRQLVHRRYPNQAPLEQSYEQQLKSAANPTHTRSTEVTTGPSRDTENGGGLASEDYRMKEVRVKTLPKYDVFSDADKAHP